MADCSSKRILTGVVAILSALTVVLIGILIWRETREKDKFERTKLTAENVIKSYPSFFRSEKDQLIYFKKYLEGYENRTLVKDIAQTSTGPCTFSCFKNESEFVPNRLRRQANRRVFHGCCVSALNFTFPSMKSNIYGVDRIFLQLPGAMQYFAVHKCLRDGNCSGCQCHQENNLQSAVVLKTHIGSIDDAEYIEDTETDLFYFDGCCKCLNN